MSQQSTSSGMATTLQFGHQNIAGHHRGQHLDPSFPSYNNDAFQGHIFPWYPQSKNDSSAEEPK